MRGALKVTFTDGSQEYFEVDPVGSAPDFVANLDAFLSRPTVTLVMEGELLVIPSSSIRHFSITSVAGGFSSEALDAIPGVLVGAKRMVS